MASGAKHPIQSIVIKEGEPYFLENKIIVALMEEIGTNDFISMIENNRTDYSPQDYEQFFQLIGIKCTKFITEPKFSKKSRDDVRKKMMS